MVMSIDWAMDPPHSGLNLGPNMANCVTVADVASNGIWLSLGFDNINFFLEQDIHTWFRRGIVSENHHLFVAACWWL